MIIIQGSNLDEHMFFFKSALEGLPLFTGPLSRLPHSWPLRVYLTPARAWKLFTLSKEVFVLVNRMIKSASK